MHLQEPLRQLKPNQLTDWKETQTCGKQYSGQKNHLNGAKILHSVLKLV